jgi:hypothetical protein
LNAYESELAHGDFSNEKNAKQIEIVPDKIYELPELIDIAERSNPITRGLPGSAHGKPPPRSV